MKSMRSTIAACLLSFAAGGGVMWAQQQQQTSRREPQFENDDMKVWKSIIMPNQPLTLHRHDHGRALVALTDGELRATDKDGKVLNVYKLTAGKAMWLGKDPPGELHGDVNPGTKPVEVIVVELKKDN